MKPKTIKYLGLGMMLGLGLATAAKADIEYVWVPAAGNTYATSGLLTESGGTLTSFTFFEAATTTFDLADFGTAPSGVVLSDGDFQINPHDEAEDPSSPYYTLTFIPNGTGPSTQEQDVSDNGQQYGDWVVVPEPTTVISGMLLLLPFGASALRVVRRNRAV